MEEKSLLELVNNALEMLTEVKRRLESGEEALTEKEAAKPENSSGSESVLSKDSPVEKVQEAPALQPSSASRPSSAPQPSPAPVSQNRSVSRGGITLEFGGFSQTVSSGGPSPVQTLQPGYAADNQPAISAARRPVPDQPEISAARRPGPDQPSATAARYPESDQPAVSAVRHTEADQPAISAARRPGTPPEPANGPRYAKRMADAAAMAAQVCSMWKFQDTTDRADEGLLKYAGSEQDAISSLSISDPDSYYLVSPEGALGLTEDGGENINWLYLPVDRTMASMPKRLKRGEPWPEQPKKPLEERARTYDMPQAPAPQGFKFCKNCGTAVKPTAKFCKNCGNRVE